MLSEYQRQYTEFNQALTRELYLHYSGQKSDYDIDRIYDRYSDLFREADINQLKDQLEKIPLDFTADRRAMAHLLTFARTNFIESNVRALTTEIMDYEADGRIECDNDLVTFRQTDPLLRNEGNPTRRRQIFRKRLNFIEGANDLRVERQVKMHESAKNLGFDSYQAMCEQMYEVDYCRLNREAETLLAATDEVYSSNLRNALGVDLGVSVEEASRADWGYFSRLNSYDSFFQGKFLLRIYRETLTGLGIDSDHQANIKIDTADRPNKQPRAFCAAIEVPAEIMLVILPSGGQLDYKVFLHEAGHAQHYGFASPSLRPEFRYSGDTGLSEMYAFLLQSLLTDPEWLRLMVRMKEPEEFVRAAHLRKLADVRRYAGKLDYELRLHSLSSPAEGSDYYAEALTNATRFRHDPAEFLIDLDDHFYSADYLRAWGFEVMLREHLLTRFGRRWWQSQRAGNLLKELWNTGNRYSADELIAQLGLGSLSFDPLIDEFARELK